MGIIKKQTIQNSIIQYVGIALGYFNAVILFTSILSTEQYGLTRVFMAISVIYVNFSSLGSPKILVRFFPYFKTSDHIHKGFLSFIGVLCLTGFSIATILFLLLKGIITSQYLDTSPLLVENYYYVIILAFSMLFTNILENYMIAKKETVLPYFLRSIFIRIIWIIEISLFYYSFIDFNTFILLYSSTYFLNFLIMLLHQSFKKELILSMAFMSFKPRVFKVLINYGLFSIVTGISNLLVNRIDIIMITFLLGLSSTSIYSIAYYISTVILVPSTSIYRISMPIVAQQWKNKNYKNMSLLYQKSSINQMLMGGFVFLCIWMNIDGLFSYLKPEYAEGKWIVFILSMSVLFNMSMGINNVITTITKYFRYDTYASISLAIVTIITNLIFIPIMGLEGAAIATLISVVSYHSYKFILIIIKLKMQPFTIKSIWALLTMVVAYSILYFIPEIFEIQFLEIAFRCILIAVIFGIFIWTFKISSDINDIFAKYLRKVGVK